MLGGRTRFSGIRRAPVFESRSLISPAVRSMSSQRRVTLSFFRHPVTSAAVRRAVSAVSLGIAVALSDTTEARGSWRAGRRLTYSGGQLRRAFLVPCLSPTRNMETYAHIYLRVRLIVAPKPSILRLESNTQSGVVTWQDAFLKKAFRQSKKRWDSDPRA